MSFHVKNIKEVILLPRKLYKIQTKVMIRDARCFTRSNHTKSCRLLVPCFHKLGWQETDMFHKKLLKNSAAPIIIIGNSIATGLRRYQHIWKNYFKDAINLGISGDRAENVLWRVCDISWQQATLSVIVHCSTNNVDQNKPEDIAEGVMRIAETFTKNQAKITTIITCTLPRDNTYSFRQVKINETNNILKAKCMNLLQTYSIEKDDLTLDENLYYKDFLHLAESGNEKLFKTICLFVQAVFNRTQASIIIITIILCPPAPSLLSPSLSSPPLPSSLVSPPPSDLVLPS